ncbi:MAG TPA: phosphoribosylanthranilate isomerase [Bradyrhizobium sp.]|nr:phosphoribosylanthranilate isomerase [Bradyrhizobium sp.]
MLTQVYEVSTPHEADAISSLGVDHIGLLVGDGTFPRELSARKAAEIIAAIRQPSKPVALFLSADVALIEQLVRMLNPPIVHLGASSELVLPADVIALRKIFANTLFMRSIPVIGSRSVSIAKSYEGAVDFLLLDSHREGDAQIGALGVTHDWTISRSIVESVRTPAILAGGLGPHNVAEAILAVRPAGVDSKTKTDLGKTHAKDLTQVAAFDRAAKNALASNNYG